MRAVERADVRPHIAAAAAIPLPASPAPPRHEMSSSATRTIEPGVSVFSAAEVRVAVVQVGPSPKDAYEAYLDALNRQRHVRDVSEREREE